MKYIIRLSCFSLILGIILAYLFESFLFVYFFHKIIYGFFVIGSILFSLAILCIHLFPINGMTHLSAAFGIALMIISAVLHAYNIFMSVFFRNPIAVITHKPLTFEYPTCYVNTTHFEILEQFNDDNKERSRLLFLLSTPASGKTITMETFAHLNKNVKYYSVGKAKFFNEKLFQSLTGGLPNEGGESLSSYLSKYKFQIDGKKPIIIIDDFQVFWSQNEIELGIDLLQEAKSLLDCYKFIFVINEWVNLDQLPSGIQERIKITKFPISNRKSRMDYFSCMCNYYLNLAQVQEKVTYDIIEEYLTNSFILNDALAKDICRSGYNMDNVEDLVMIISNNEKEISHMISQHFHYSLNFELENFQSLDEMTESQKAIFGELEKILMSNNHQIIWRPVKLPKEVVNKKILTVTRHNLTDYVSFYSKLHMIYFQLLREKIIKGSVNK